MDMTTEKLVKNLNDYITQIYGNLDSFDIKDVGEIEKLRTQIKKWCKKFDDAEITSINYEPAIYGGIKATVEQKIITRKMAEKISQETGYSKDELLYSGLSIDGREKIVAAKIQKKRQEDIAECFEDFQNQLKVKHILLQMFLEQTGVMEENRTLRRKMNQKEKMLQKTPSNNIQIDPFDINVINEKYFKVLIKKMNPESTKYHKTIKEPISFNLDESWC